MSKTVPTAERKSESKSAAHPYAATASFLRDACGGCRVDTARPAAPKK